MTNEEAIKILTAISNDIIRMFGKGNGVSAFDLAIEALEKQNADGCVGCEFECRQGDEEPCSSCCNNYVNKWAKANWQE